MLKQRLDFRSKQHLITHYGVIQGLDAEVVPCQENGALSAVIQRKGEHAVKAADAFYTPLLVGVHDDFSVGRRLEDMSETLEFCPQLDEVVNFAVENDLD